MTTLASETIYTIFFKRSCDMSLLGFFPFHLFCVTVISCYVDMFVFELSLSILLWLTNDESGVTLTLN